MLYQCTWCVYGAENEGELLEHASAKHPTKIPQAYLRVITQKVRTFLVITNLLVLFMLIVTCKPFSASRMETRLK